MCLLLLQYLTGLEHFLLGQMTLPIQVTFCHNLVSVVISRNDLGFVFDVVGSMSVSLSIVEGEKCFNWNFHG